MEELSRCETAGTTFSSCYAEELRIEEYVCMYIHIYTYIQVSPAVQNCSGAVFL